MTPQQPRRSGRPGPRRTRPKQVKGEPLTGTRFEVEVGAVAHGGFCIARHEGRAVFVRHTIPGERVVVEVTEGGSEDRFLRADAVEVLDASPHRVAPPCPYAGPGRCGGCDWQHVALGHQRELKAAVVAEQLDRLAGLELAPGALEVEPVPGDRDGLRWRTRLELAVDPEGRAGLRAHRSREVVPVDDCLIATEKVARSGALGTVWEGCDSVVVADATQPEQAAVVPVTRAEARPAATVVEDVDLGDWGHSYRVAADGFWQVHPGAPATLVEAVLEMAELGEGMSALDLYCGVGLFTAPVADLVGEDGRVLAVEGDALAVEHAEENLAEHPNAEVVRGDVRRVVAGLADEGEHFDVVVLDPPRAGAGRDVVEAVADLEPTAVVYVACDPGALARDVSYLEAVGYQLVDLRAFDTFPMTQHVECVALLVPADEDDEGDEGGEDGEDGHVARDQDGA